MVGPATGPRPPTSQEGCFVSQGLKNLETLVAWKVKESFNVRILHCRVPN